MRPETNLPHINAHQSLPFYTYDESGSNRRENITDWALAQFRSHYHGDKIDKWSIFYYVYGLLHHPGYREKFADNLKRELPRIPFAPRTAGVSRAQVTSDSLSTDGVSPARVTKAVPNRAAGTAAVQQAAGFWAFSSAGKKLAELHLNYETLEPYPLNFQETPGLPLSYRVDDKMRFLKDKSALVVNKSLTLRGIPAEAFKYRLGNRSALEWVIDQYQVSADARSGITSDPNREDDPQYIIRLVGQVIAVSLETVKIVEGLPGKFSEG